MVASPLGERAVLSRLWPIVDLVVVVGFVLIGRDTHEEGNAISDVVRTAAPFVIGLVVGWGIAGASRSPVAWRTGAISAAATVVIGLAIRRLGFSDGIAWPFIVVTTLFVFAGLVGWRVIASRVSPRRRSG